MKEHVVHPIPPLYDSKSRVLILGSFPSVRSREQEFFYAHRQNRFWRVMAHLLSTPCPVSVEEKRHMLLSHGIALWDVIGACEIEGSADSSIRSVVVNDIERILKQAPIRRIFLNGKTAAHYYDLYLKDRIPIDAVCLPSTSAANASWSLSDLTKAWGAALLQDEIND